MVWANASGDIRYSSSSGEKLLEAASLNPVGHHSFQSSQEGAEQRQEESHGLKCEACKPNTSANQQERKIGQQRVRAVVKYNVKTHGEKRRGSTDDLVKRHRDKLKRHVGDGNVDGVEKGEEEKRDILAIGEAW